MMTEDDYLQIAAMIVAAGGIAYALHLIWRHLLCPTYQFFRNASAFFEAQPTLLSIAQRRRLAA